MATQSDTQRKNPNSSGSGRSAGSSGNRRSTGSTQDKRTTSSKSGTGRGTSGKRGSGGKKNGGSDKWVNIFLVLLLILIVVLAILYFRKGSEKSGEPTPTPTQQVQLGGVTPPPESVTSEPGTPTPLPTDEPEPEASPTEAQPMPSPTEMLEPTPTPEESADITPTPQATEAAEEGIGTGEADEILADVFWEAGYRFTLLNTKFVVDGEMYYRYDAAYDGQAQDYDVLVRKSDGELYYYEDGVRREFDGLPEHTKQPDAEEIGTMTADAAAELLKQFSYLSLGLPAELDECSLALDNWKTVVQGEECFCLNVFYNGALAGNIYFTENAEHVYYLDEFGEFVRVR